MPEEGRRQFLVPFLLSISLSFFWVSLPFLFHMSLKTDFAASAGRDLGDRPADVCVYIGRSGLLLLFAIHGRLVEELRRLLVRLSAVDGEGNLGAGAGGAVADVG